MDKFCYTCGLRDAITGICGVLGVETADRDRACKYHTANPGKCELCGQTLLKDQMILHLDDPNRTHITCAKCSAAMNTCRTCGRGHECAFKTDPSPIPHTIQQRIQQGPMTQIVQVKNPARVDATCKAGCPCWDSVDEACNKEAGCCGGYVCLWD